MIMLSSLAELQDKRTEGFEPAIACVLAGEQVRAGSFIVTLYGDVVEPRGGRLWMGNIIDTCATVGISETRVRTAVSRLVAAGQLVGERMGRRSFYRLTDGARSQFLRASRIVFEPRSVSGWQLVWIPPGADDALAGLLEDAGFRRLAPAWFLGPDNGLEPLVANMADTCLFFSAKTEGGKALLQAMSASQWPLDQHAQGYHDFLARFGALEAHFGTGGRVLPEQALRTRLLLVHLYRKIVLRDPRLPDDVLPADWPGKPARDLFIRLYLGLSASADGFVGSHFLSQSGALASETDVTQHRLKQLQQQFS